MDPTMDFPGVCWSPFFLKSGGGGGVEISTEEEFVAPCAAFGLRNGWRDPELLAKGTLTYEK